jgi:endonuclease YncB( thermonuclease family)
MADGIHNPNRAERRKVVPLRKPDRRQRVDRRQADRRGKPRRRADRPQHLLLAVIGLAVGGYIALSLRTAHLSATPVNGDVTPVNGSATPVNGRFALCGGGVWRACVVDGDTIRFRGATIRVADINAPETRDARCRAERRLGRRATERLRALLNAGPFELVRAGRQDTDRYGRKLRLLRRNGRSLGTALVEEGLARPWSGRRKGWCG